MKFIFLISSLNGRNNSLVPEKYIQCVLLVLCCPLVEVRGIVKNNFKQSTPQKRRSSEKDREAPVAFSNTTPVFGQWNEPHGWSLQVFFALSSSQSAPRPHKEQDVLPSDSVCFVHIKEFRGFAQCWKRRCPVVSRQHMDSALPGLDTEPTRTSSWELCPETGKNNDSRSLKHMNSKTLNLETILVRFF